MSDPLQAIPDDAWTAPTTGAWQSFEPSAAWRDRLQPPYRYGLPVAVDAERVLVLPIRRLPQSADRAVASLISNQASLEVVDHLSAAMAALALPLRPDCIIGLPTLGMVFAPGVARGLGHARWVPMGYSRKFWYDGALATSVRSITSPGAHKSIYLDPNQLPLLQGRGVMIVDDVVSSAETLARVWDLLEHLQLEVVGAVVAMRQGQVWQATLGPSRCARLKAMFDSPQLRLRGDGWWPAEP